MVDPSTRRPGRTDELDRRYLMKAAVEVIRQVR
jgi:hypothetical protein